MEDGVEEIQSIIMADEKRSSLRGDHIGGADQARGVEQVIMNRDDEEAEEVELGGKEERACGLTINNFISTVVFGTAAAGGDDEEEEEQEKNKTTCGGELESINEGEAAGGSGLLNHLISHLTSPRLVNNNNNNSKRKAAGDDDDELAETALKQEDKRGADHGFFSQSVEEEFGGTSNSGDGGIIKGLISNIFHQNGGGGEIKDVNQLQGVEQENPESGGGGGLVESLVSCLPTPLATVDAAPATDEASILIHSLVHD